MNRTLSVKDGGVEPFRHGTESIPLPDVRLSELTSHKTAGTTQSGEDPVRVSHGSSTSAKTHVFHFYPYSKSQDLNMEVRQVRKY